MYKGSSSARARGSHGPDSATTPLLLDSMDEEAKGQHLLRVSYSKSPHLVLNNNGTTDQVKSAPWWSYFWVSVNLWHIFLFEGGTHELRRDSGL